MLLRPHVRPRSNVSLRFMFLHPPAMETCKFLTDVGISNDIPDDISSLQKVFNISSIKNGLICKLRESTDLQKIYQLVENIVPEGVVIVHRRTFFSRIYRLEATLKKLRKARKKMKQKLNNFFRLLLISQLVIRHQKILTLQERKD